MLALGASARPALLCFSFPVTTLPLSPAASPPVRVLLIDDDQNTLFTITRVLQSAGFEVTESDDGQGGVDLARRLRPDIVICDVNMPKMDGYGVLRELKKDPRTAVIPFIFLSGAQDHEMVRRGMGLGADDYVTKPFEPRELFDSIRARIERQRQITRKLEDLRVSIALSVPSELFTPLNTVMGFSMLVLDQLRAGSDVPRDDLEDAMTNIHQAGEQLLRIGSNYVLYAQLATEESAPTPAPAPVAHDEWEPRLARAVRKLALHHTRMKDLHYGFGEATLGIRPDHLEKLVTELLDNAFKFSRPGQSVRVTGAVRDKDYVLQIADQGRGLTPEEIESLAPMVQMDRVRLMQGGVGLGFAISRALALRCGGSVSVRPNGEQGLLVEVVLPLAR